MNNRELFHATMNRENGSRLLHMEQGFNIQYKKWLEQGLPVDIANIHHLALTKQENLYDHMNVAGYLSCYINDFCIPEFENRILEEKDGRCTLINGNGVTLMERTDRIYENTSWSPPHEIDFSIKTPYDYEENRYRLIGNINKRYDEKWLNENSKIYREQPDHPVALMATGPFAFLRELVGVENAMVLPYEESDMIRLMLKDHLDTSMAAAEPVIKACKPDMCVVFEDCCGSTGPFISPTIFEKLMAPWYREWKDYLKSMGVNWIMLDTDGNPTPLVKLWYENGVDCLQPWEVNAVDMLKFAEDYPQYVMMGGIYKHMFEPGDLAQVGRFKSIDIKQTISQELERVVKPMAKRGGYIASLDHWAFWGVTYEGYKYYSQILTEKYGKSNKVNRFGISSYRDAILA